MQQMNKVWWFFHLWLWHLSLLVLLVSCHERETNSKDSKNSQFAK